MSNAATERPPVADSTPTKPRLLDVLREGARRQGHSEATISAFASWVGGFVRFHQMRHPRDLDRRDETQAGFSNTLGARRESL